MKSWLIRKDPDAGKDWRREEKGTTENEMVGWHHRLDGHEFKQAPGVGDGQGGLACCSPWGLKELDTTERLNWTELNWPFIYTCEMTVFESFLSFGERISTSFGGMLCQVLVAGCRIFWSGLSWWSDSKESACNAGELGLTPGLERSPGGGHGNPLQYSCLENPHGQRRLSGYSPWGSQRTGHDWGIKHS